MGSLTARADRAPGATPESVPYVAQSDDGGASLNLIVEGVHCPSCIHIIESTLLDLPGVIAARLNFSTRRLAVSWDPRKTSARDLIDALQDRGYRTVPFDPARLAAVSDREDKSLLRALGVAGFAAANVMLLSVAVWSGLASDMGAATRGLFHWISALIALPAMAYAGRPFFRSALGALRQGALNMDVPISLAVILAAGMSLFQTVTGGDQVYFDASVMLLFFLLVGRFLDRRMRTKAGFAAQNLLALRSVAAQVLDAEGRQRAVPVETLRPGMTVAVAAGERIPVDGILRRGRSEIDCSLVTGESLPQLAAPGDKVFAGTLNLGDALEVDVTAADDQTMLAEIVRLMEAAEQGRARYVRLADRVARVYAPAVHLLGLLTFAGWWLVAGAGWETALIYAIAVLIVTCPCALGLAVPAVQVVASGSLLRRGILIKAADGLERLAEVDTVVFDKTGTLTLGRPELTNKAEVPRADLALAAAMALSSRHPLSRAIVEAAGGLRAALPVSEIAGCGLKADIDGQEVRLGKRSWCGLPNTEDNNDEGSELWLVRPSALPVRFSFRDRLREDAPAVVRGLRQQGFDLRLLSGDRAAAVESVAKTLAIETWQAEADPADKIRLLESLAAEGRKVLMVGDGLNDAPALAAAHASLSPSTAADISQTSADFVFQGEALAPLLVTLKVAQRSRRLILQNFALAFFYNAIAVPLAMAGWVTPLIAALAMSASSIAVTSNALRLRLKPGGLG